MDVKELLFFNKEGYQINMNYDNDLDQVSGKIYFDKNSTDTFKTQGVYLFEKVQGTNNTFQAQLNKYQLFNTNSFITYPKYQAIDLEITNIELVNVSATYNTKWIYAVGIENYYYTGMWVSFEGLNGFHNNDFNDALGGEIQGRKVLAVEIGRILVWTETDNSNALPTFTANPSIIVKPMNVIEVQQSYQGAVVTSGLPLSAINVAQNITVTAPEPTWTESPVNGLLYDGKKISLVDNTENAGVYTIKTPAKARLRHYTKLSPTLFTPVAGDKLILEFDFKTSRIPLFIGTIDIVDNGPVINADIIVGYIPKFLQVGDLIVIQETVPATLNGANTQTVDVVAIDRTTNTITVNTTSYVGQTGIPAAVYLGTNKYTITQDIVLDNNNIYSLPVTYWSIVNQYQEILNSLPGGARIDYLKDTDQLIITSDYTDDFTTLAIKKKSVTNVITQLTSPAYLYEVTPIFVTEPLISEEHIYPDSSVYERRIVFTSIDNFGLNMFINGVRYDVDFDISPANTITDFVTAHSAALATIGIFINQTTTVFFNDTLTITSEFPNINVALDLDLGDTTVYQVQYKDIEFNNIKSQLLITINNLNYIVPFNTSDFQTVSDWVTMYAPVLKTYGIIVANDGINPIINFGILDPTMTFNITYNIGYIPKSGDLSVYETLYATNAQGSVIAGNELRISPVTANFLNYYATGQKIAISGAVKLPQNKSYNILALSQSHIDLSYQGAFWNDPTGPGTKAINVVSDYFIRFPKTGLSAYDNQVKFIWSWKDTQIKDFFFYDFTGNQLQPWTAGFPNYNGITPLCGPNGDTDLKLISTPNKELEFISEPTKQQTVFDLIQYTLPYLDTPENVNLEPQPLQVFMGYNSELESWSKARMYLSIIEDVTYNSTSDNIVTTNPSPPALNTDTVTYADDWWIFKDNYVEIQNVLGLNFNALGYKPNQYVKFGFMDVNIDNRQIATLNNGGKVYKIQSVLANKIIFTTNVIPETSVKKVAKTTLPFYDISQNELYEFRTLNVSMTVIPRVAAYFDVYGESEEEDIRHKININNKNINLLKLQDFYIFKEVDINEQGIDWVFLNRKRKELLEIYPEIFNNLASYKSVIQAINFFGYNDLTFTEYFQNINPESKKFGQLFNMELLQLFDKSTKGFQYSNLAFENLRNAGYRKTNLFSLNYLITDTQGNFVNGYSLDEVRVKLLGLKKWLTENIIPVGTKIVDINGKYQMPQNFVLKHETYRTNNFRVEEYTGPVDFNVTGYLEPISLMSNTYQISVEYISAQAIDWFEYNIRTFYLEQWNATLTYTSGSYVYHLGKIYVSTAPIALNEEPGISSNWTKTTINSLPNVQILKNYEFALLPGTSFTVDKLVDPHFEIEVMWHSGYGTSHITKKAYSVIPNFFFDI